MRQARRDRGQILPIVAVALVGLLGICAFSIDVGYAYYAKRQLQSATDAAALAGAQDLPPARRRSRLRSTMPRPTRRRICRRFTFTYSLKCTATAIVATGCTASVNPNELFVTGTASTTTLVRPDLRPQALQHDRARERVQPVLIDARGHRDRDRPHRLDVRHEGIGRLLHRSRQCQGRRPDHAELLNPPDAQVGMVAFPPVQTTLTGACSAPYNSLGHRLGRL